MKAILKKDFYENFKSTILSIIYILALSISLNLVNYATSKVFLGRFILVYGLVIISLNYCLRDVNNSNYMDYYGVFTVDSTNSLFLKPTMKPIKIPTLADRIFKNYERN